MTDTYEEVRHGRKLTIKRADGGLLLTIATMHRMETVPLTEKRTGDLARWLGGELQIDKISIERDVARRGREAWRAAASEAIHERDEWKALATSVEVTLKQQQGASTDQLEEANRTGQAMGAAAERERIAVWLEDGAWEALGGTDDEAPMSISGDPGDTVLRDLAKLVRAAPFDPVAHQLERLKAMPDGHVCPALPEGARVEMDDGVEWVALTGPRPTDNRRVRASTCAGGDVAFVMRDGRMEPITRRVAETVLAVLRAETPLGALVAKARERAPNLFHDAAELAAIGQTVEPRDTEPPRREAVAAPRSCPGMKTECRIHGCQDNWEWCKSAGCQSAEGTPAPDPLRRLSGSELDRVPPVDAAAVDRALMEGWTDRVAAETPRPPTPAPEPEDRSEPPPWLEKLGEEHAVSLSLATYGTTWDDLEPNVRSDIWAINDAMRGTPAPEPDAAHRWETLWKLHNELEKWAEGLAHIIWPPGPMPVPTTFKDIEDWVKAKAGEGTPGSTATCDECSAPRGHYSSCSRADPPPPDEAPGGTVSTLKAYELLTGDGWSAEDANRIVDLLDADPGSTEPADYSTKPAHIREVERVFDASGERLVRIAKEAAALWLADQSGCSSTELRVPVPEESTEP